MGIRDFKLKWVHGTCRGRPTYISNDKILIPSQFFMKTCNITGNNVQYHFEPRIKIGCCSSLPELGIIAVSERKASSAIYVLSYPEMIKLKVLEQSNNEPYAALVFAGLELLVSLQIKNCYEIDLWKWSSGERVYFLSIPLMHSEVPFASLSVNPLWWYQILLQCDARIIFLVIKQTDDRYILEGTSYFFSMDKENKIEMFTKNEQNNQKNFQNDVIKPMFNSLTIQSICWLPESNFLVATSKAILKVESTDSTLHKLADNLIGVSAMIFCKSGLFIGYKTGYIDIVCILGNRWNLIETINIDQPIDHLLLSPDYNYLVIKTLKGSIFYREINQKKLDFSTLLRAEFGGEVAVSFIGPLSKLCVTVKKNGFMHVFRSIDGSILSRFHLEEEIVSLATSPLCYCIVIGTNTGFLYFIDVTDVQKPKIVHCERPYEIPVDHLKFDNFGRYLVSSAQNQPVKIWNGLPSSAFRSLGSKKISSQVKDFTIFCRAENDETVLLILVESGSGSDKQVGNVLIKLELPVDFGSDPKKYQIDVFGTLSGDALNFQKRTLEKPSCNVNVHWSLGAIFYSSAAQKVFKYSIWSNFANSTHQQILSIKHVSYMCMSTDHFWIAITDLYGYIHLYTSKGFVLSASSQKYCAEESICRSFVNFPLSSDLLIYGRENGMILCFDWEDCSNTIKNVPEWVVYCYSRYSDENKALHSIEEEGRLDLDSQVNKIKDSNLVTLDELSEAIKVWILILNFNLEKLLGDQMLDNSFISTVFSEDSVEKISLTNRKKLSLITPEKFFEEEKVVKKSGKENAIKTISSFSLGFVTQNYSRESIEGDVNRIKKLNSLSDKKFMKKPLPNWSFCKSVKIKYKEERLQSVINLINEIIKLKSEFNENFEKLYETKPSVSNRSDDAIVTAKGIARSLPSKAERDFWNASVIERGFGRLSENVEHLYTNSTDSLPKGNIETAKSSIENHVKSARNIQEEFDSNVETLLLKKHYCDCKIFKLEIKILAILLFSEQEDKFSNWKEEIEEKLKHLENLQNNTGEIIKEFLDLEKNAKDIYLTLQKTERNKTYKIDMKCLKIYDEKALSVLKKQPTLQLDNKSENPFWSPCPKILPDLTMISKCVSFLNPSSNGEHKEEWITLCNKQIRILKIGVIMRHIQSHLLAITNTKQECIDANLLLKRSQSTIQKVMKSMSMLVSKCSNVFNSLLITKLQNIDLKLEGDPKSEENFFSLTKVSSIDHKIWKDIDHEVGKMRGIQLLLEETERLFRDLNELKSEMASTVQIIEKEHEEMMKIAKDKLEDEKGNFMKAKLAAEDILSENKRNMLKAMKSHFLTSKTIQGKTHECEQ